MARDATTDDTIVREAHDLFRAANSVLSESRALMLDDQRFAIGDSDNGYQWPQSILTDRTREKKPALTINMTRVHNKHIVNNACKQVPNVQILPLKDSASQEAAEAQESILRYIESRSRPEYIKRRVLEDQVTCGAGYVRVLTEYADNSSFDQEIRLATVEDPMSVVFDPDASCAIDARYCFVYNDMSRAAAEEKYPEIKNMPAAKTGSLFDNTAWVTDDNVRVAEFFRKKTRKKTLVAVYDVLNGGYAEPMLEDEAKSQYSAEQLAHERTMRRQVDVPTIEWFKIVGDTIVERSVWAGKYIPIVPSWGERRRVGGKLFINGNTRHLKDPQRMFNYNASSAIEYGALQTKTQWKIAIEGMGDEIADYYKKANIDNLAFLPYRQYDSQGRPINPPDRVAPPMSAPLFMDGMSVARDQMMQVSGQFAPTFGADQQDASGRAISMRQFQADNATYDYIDNNAQCWRDVYTILLDLYPRIYDTRRILQIVNEVGENKTIVIDVNAPEAYSQQEGQHGDAVTIINPTMGRFEVKIGVTPSSDTQRQQAFETYANLISQNPALGQIIGDLFMRSGDFKFSTEAAERLRRLVPAQAMSDQPPQELIDANNQIQALQQQLNDALAFAQQAQLKLADKSEENGIREYDAVTKRIDVAAKISPLPNAMDVAAQAGMDGLIPLEHEQFEGHNL